MERYSVLMSTYQKESPAFLRTAIESMLQQTVKPSELVLVCDGALTEELNQVIDSFGEKLSVYRHAENLGLGPSLREGLCYCHEDIIVRMDSDDISFSDRCARELQAMQEHNADIVSGTVLEFSDMKSRDVNPEMQHGELTKADIVQADEIEVDSTYSDESRIDIARPDESKVELEIIGKRELPEQQADILRYSRKRNPFNHPAVCFRKDVILKAGGYNGDFPLFEDYDLWTRVLQNGAQGYNIPEPILYMRTTKDLYKRRGGLKYAENMLRFHRSLLKRGYITFMDFLTGAVPHAAICVLPADIRKLVYQELHS